MGNDDKHETVGVVGAGVMGAEIALVCALAGHRVTLVDIDEATVARGLDHARAAGGRLVARTRRSDGDLAAALSLIAPATAPAALADCAIVIEAVPEVAAIKEPVLRAIAAAVSPAALIASNTSGLSISALARVAAPAERVLGLHFFNPPAVMALVEVIRGERTAPETLAQAQSFARGLGKRPVLVRECPGFVVNRVLVRALVAAYRRTTDSGAEVAAADAAVVAAGPAPMGPHALGDLIGLDTLEAIRADLERAYGARFAGDARLSALVSAGRFGRKSGGGFMRGRPADVVPDPALVAAMAQVYYGEARDEAQRLEAEQIATAADIDLALELGAGWSTGPLTMEVDQR